MRGARVTGGSSAASRPACRILSGFWKSALISYYEMEFGGRIRTKPAPRSSVADLLEAYWEAGPGSDCGGGQAAAACVRPASLRAGISLLVC